MRSSLLLFLFALPSHALAWTSSTTPASTWVSTYDVEINSSGSDTLSFGDVERIFDESLDAWVTPACSDFSYAFDGTTSVLSSANGDNRNVHGFLSSWPAGYGDRTSVLGLTSSRYVGSGGGSWRNAEADISYNEDYFTFVDRAPSGAREADLQSVSTHENGHALGLGHSTDSRATMYPTVLTGTGSRTLSADDRAGVCTLYPSGDTGTTTTPSPDGCVYDFSAYGAESCDTAWYELGVDCETLESSYGWDCEGCECPGDGDIPDDDGCVFDFSAYGSESCDTAWLDFGVDCATLEASYGWDCRGCECPGDAVETGTGGTTTTEPTNETTPTDETTSGDETTPDDETTTGTTSTDDDNDGDTLEDDAALLDEPQAQGCGCSTTVPVSTSLVWLVALFGLRSRRR